MYQLGFYVPESHLESVKLAIFNAGAGQIGNYQQCAWQILGQGQFQPTANATPYLGQKNQITQVKEYYVQLVCSPQHITQAITALKSTHPYEEPAYHVIKLENF